MSFSLDGVFVSSEACSGTAGAGKATRPACNGWQHCTCNSWSPVADGLGIFAWPFCAEPLAYAEKKPYAVTTDPVSLAGQEGLQGRRAHAIREAGAGAAPASRSWAFTGQAAEGLQFSTEPVFQ